MTTILTQGEWLGGSNLDSDDAIILAGDGQLPLGGEGNSLSRVTVNAFGISWASASGFGGIMNSLGVMARPGATADTSVSLFDTPGLNFLGQGIGGAAVASVPVSILISQGLV